MHTKHTKKNIAIRTKFYLGICLRIHVALNGAKQNCRIVHILGILLVTSYWFGFDFRDIIEVFVQFQFSNMHKHAQIPIRIQKDKSIRLENNEQLQNALPTVIVNHFQFILKIF